MFAYAVFCFVFVSPCLLHRGHVDAVLTKFPSNATLSTGDTLKLTCASNYTTIPLKWQLDGFDIGRSGATGYRYYDNRNITFKLDERIEEDSREYDLIAESVLPAYSGRYTCKERNGNGDEFSVYVHVTGESTTNVSQTVSPETMEFVVIVLAAVTAAAIVIIITIAVVKMRTNCWLRKEDAVNPRPLNSRPNQYSYVDIYAEINEQNTENVDGQMHADVDPVTNTADDQYAEIAESSRSYRPPTSSSSRGARSRDIYVAIDHRQTAM